MELQLQWIGENSSVVSATAYFRKTNGYTTTGTFSGTITIDGTAYSIKRYGTWQSSYIAIGSASKTVAHNADGTTVGGDQRKVFQFGNESGGDVFWKRYGYAGPDPAGVRDLDGSILYSGRAFYRGDQSKFQLVYPYCIGEGKWS